jgi:hypothetical protein
MRSFLPGKPKAPTLEEIQELKESVPNARSAKANNLPDFYSEYWDRFTLKLCLRFQ